MALTGEALCGIRFSRVRPLFVYLCVLASMKLHRAIAIRAIVREFTISCGISNPANGAIFAGVSARSTRKCICSNLNMRMIVRENLSI